MQKKIIVLAIAAALSAPAVALADSANVTLYGAANLSADYITTGDEEGVGGQKGVSKLVVSSNQTFVGLKGSEDLGGGMSALWTIESIVDADTNGGFAGKRNAFVALKSGMGQVLLGKYDTPYKRATRRLDVFPDGLGDNRALMGQSSDTTNPFDGRPSNLLEYTAPTFSDVSVSIARANTQEARTIGGSPSGHLLSLAGVYNAGPFFGSLAYETHVSKAAGTSTDTSENAVKLGFGYTQDAFSVGVAFEQTDDDLGAACGKAAGKDCYGHTAIYVGGKYNLASGAVKLAVTTADEYGDPASKDTDAMQFSVGYDHNLSKRTTAYVMYTMIDNGKNVDYGLAGISTGGGASSVTGNGADPSALSVGVKHVF